MTSKSKVCAKVSTKIKAQRKVNDTDIFVDEVETQLRENHSGAAKPRNSTIQKTKLDTRQ
jgi:hypothetical protein